MNVPPAAVGHGFPVSIIPVAVENWAQWPAVTEPVELTKLADALMVWFGQVPVMLPILVPATSPGVEVPVPPFATGKIPATLVERLTGKLDCKEVVEIPKVAMEDAKEAVEIESPENVIAFP